MKFPPGGTLNDGGDIRWNSAGLLLTTIELTMRRLPPGFAIANVTLDEPPTGVVGKTTDGGMTAMLGDDVIVTQAPFTQVDIGMQTLPQVPQLFTLLTMFVSQPLARVPSQLAKPALQEAMVQMPIVQAGLPLATLQTDPHDPQLLTLFETSTQVVPMGVMQSCCGGAHVAEEQTPPTHELPAQQLELTMQAPPAGTHALASGSS